MIRLLTEITAQGKMLGPELAVTPVNGSFPVCFNEVRAPFKNRWYDEQGLQPKPRSITLSFHLLFLAMLPGVWTAALEQAWILG